MPEDTTPCPTPQVTHLSDQAHMYTRMGDGASRIHSNAQGLQAPSQSQSVTPQCDGEAITDDVMKALTTHIDGAPSSANAQPSDLKEMNDGAVDFLDMFASVIAESEKRSVIDHDTALQLEGVAREVYALNRNSLRSTAHSRDSYHIGKGASALLTSDALLPTLSAHMVHMPRTPRRECARHHVLA